jgi:predicted nicotinamide N-methyase
MELVVETASKRAVLKDDQEEAFYSIYSINEKTIACRSLRMHNEVGTKIWGAGLFLSSLCINRSDLFANRRVIELGSGIGLTGLCLSTAKSPPRDIILSDYTVDTMNNLKHNLDLNRAAVSLGCSLTALRLDWTLYKDVTSQYYKNIAGKLGSVDVILAADCTYSPDICVDLTESIKSMLQASYNAIDMPRECCLYTTSDESLDEVMASTPSCLKAFPYALVASTLRNEETFQCFQAALRESNMIVDDITEWAVSAAGQSNYFYQSDVSVEVIKVFCLHLQSAIVSSCITR